MLRIFKFVLHDSVHFSFNICKQSSCFNRGTCDEEPQNIIPQLSNIRQSRSFVRFYSNNKYAVLILNIIALI